MIKVIGILGVALLALFIYHAHKTSTLSQELGAATSACERRLAEFERDAQHALAEHRMAAEQVQGRLVDEFQQQLEGMADELEERSRNVQELQRRFDERLQRMAQPEETQWLDTDMPESLLYLDQR